tara:strand:+ start:171 stop:593 length:423 start_codon:yes stop_codon:yes gene_type:complete
MKYWKVIRRFILRKYDITTAELDMMFFLHDEVYFTKEKFQEFNKIFRWDKNKFNNLRMNGWIDAVTTFNLSRGRKKYRLSLKGSRMINYVYTKLDGEILTTDRTKNPLFKTKVKYSDKAYKNMIIEMNNFIKQQQHHSPE